MQTYAFYLIPLTIIQSYRFLAVIAALLFRMLELLLLNWHNLVCHNVQTLNLIRKAYPSVLVEFLFLISPSF